MQEKGEFRPLATVRLADAGALPALFFPSSFFMESAMPYCKQKWVAVLVFGAWSLAMALPAWGQNLPRSFRISTNPQGSLFYRAGAAVAKVLSSQLPVPSRVQPFAGTSVALPLVDKGEVELGVNNTNDSRMAYRGMEPFQPTPNLRVLTVLFTLRVAFFVPANSDIRSVEDLRGKRIPSQYKAQLAVWFNATSILAGAGMDWDDVKGVPTANVVTGTNLLIEGKVDAALFAIGAGKVKEANAKISGGVRFIPINSSPEAIRRMQKTMPGTYPLLVKANKRLSVLEDIRVEAYDVFIVTSTLLSDDAAVAVVKALHKAEKEVKAAFPPLRSFSRGRMVKKNVTIPYHPGAIKAYKELGLWSPGMDAVQAKLLSEAAR